MLMLGAFES